VIRPIVRWSAGAGAAPAATPAAGAGAPGAGAGATTTRVSPVSGSYSSRRSGGRAAERPGAAGPGAAGPGVRAAGGGAPARLPHGKAGLRADGRAAAPAAGAAARRAEAAGLRAGAAAGAGRGSGAGTGLPSGSAGRPLGANAKAPPVRTWTVPSSTRSNRMERSSAYSCLRAPSSSASAVSLMPGVTMRDRLSKTACRSIVVMCVGSFVGNLSKRV
jgi:hypothetical protein